MKSKLSVACFILGVLFVTAAAAQIQFYEIKVHDTVDLAEAEVSQPGNLAVALLPMYVQKPAPYMWEMMGWMSVTAPAAESGGCLLSANGQVPYYGTGGPCHGSGLTPTPTTVVFNSFADAKTEFDSKPLIMKQSCVLLREPGHQTFTWMATASGRYWLTCQNSFFAYNCLD